MAEYTVTLPIYFIKNMKKKQKVLLGINWYRLAHWAQAGKAKKFIAELINEELEGMNPLNSPIHVHYDVYFKNIKSDGGNVRSIMEKFALDGFVENGIIKEDNILHVVSDSSKYYIDKEFPRIEVTISEINNLLKT